ncbi:hypothetical protein SAMN05421640_1778 [Ekhidna lutea]|uniref:Uncharacterized protein n=1 Tax=Ekhidna lutea TaxID=447679 RepID=A0A239IQS2_EKHLU|nr:hypothetical protein [Ekhidna lutea]SNS95907.1 hypothetical protein SAMN05421640_1778 [Ekhidna lutea]
MKNLLILVSASLLWACGSEIKKENRHLVEAIDYRVKHIDQNHRVSIIEDDFVEADSAYKVRGYFNEGRLMKLVGIIKTPHFERDDYFYFENEKPIFSGHMMNFKDDRLAEEFKYYYQDGTIVESLFWKDHYTPGKRFPHETFKEFDPNMDSLMNEEKDRMAFFLSKLEEEGFELKHINENLEANSNR